MRRGRLGYGLVVVAAAVVIEGTAWSQRPLRGCQAGGTCSGTAPVPVTVVNKGSYSDAWTGSSGDHGDERVSWTATETDRFVPDPATHTFKLVSHQTSVQVSGTLRGVYPTSPASQQVSCTVNSGVIGWAVGVAPLRSDSLYPASVGATVGPPEIVLEGQNCNGFGPKGTTGKPAEFECSPLQGCFGTPTSSSATMRAWQGAFNAGVQGLLAKLPVTRHLGGTISGPDERSTISEDIRISGAPPCPTATGGLRATQTASGPLLHIVDLLRGGNIEGTTQTAVTGEHMRLQAYCGSQQPDRVRWTIAGLSTSSPISSSAVEGLTYGRPPRPLTQAELRRNTIDFFFFQPGTWTIGVKDLTIGQSRTVRFRVLKPNPGLRPLLWGRIGVTRNGPGGALLNHMIVGVIPGPRYRFNPQIPAGVVGGEFGITEIYTSNSRVAPQGVQDDHGPALDNCFYLALQSPAGVTSVNVPSPGTTAFTFVDAPNSSLGPPVPQRPGTRVRLNVTLRTYLIFIPQGGIPVGLALIRMNFIAQAGHAIVGASPFAWTLVGPQKQPNGGSTASANAVVEPIWTGRRFSNTAPGFTCPPPPTSGLGDPPAVLPPPGG